jgi:hypothetical protein
MVSTNFKQASIVLTHFIQFAIRRSTKHGKSRGEFVARRRWVEDPVIRCEKGSFRLVASSNCHQHFQRRKFYISPRFQGPFVEFYWPDVKV